MTDGSIITWTAPESEVPSPDFTVEAAGEKIFVYQAPVRAEILQNDGLWTHKPDYKSERAAFAIFDMTGAVKVKVKPVANFTSALILPEGLGIEPTIKDGVIEFGLDKPRKLTVVLDGDDRTALHLFAGEPETDVPVASDPNVLYFGPGIHEIDGIKLKDNQTLYVAGGAILKPKLTPGDKGTYDEKWKVTFHHGKVLDLTQVKNVRVCGRGIIDASLIPHPGWHMIVLEGAKHVTIEGITLRNAANWNFIIGASEEVCVRDVRIISGRLNSDGINTVNSRKVRITDCFVRNHDDSFAVKTTKTGAPAADIKIEDCVVWNDWGYALGVTYETRSPIHDVEYRHNSIINSKHWFMGVHLSDGALVERIRFIDTEIGSLCDKARSGSSTAMLTQQPLLLRAAIVQDCWGNDGDRGQVRDVLIDRVRIYGKHPFGLQLQGFDANHTIDGVVIRNVRQVNGEEERKATLPLQKNDFVHNLRIEKPGTNLPPKIPRDEPCHG